MITLFLSYLESKQYSPHTLGAYSRDLKQFANFTALNPSLRDWKNSLTGSPNSINRKIAAVKSFYNWANKFGHLAVNPAKDLQFKKKPGRLPKFIPNLNIPDNIPLKHRIILCLLSETGIRLNELVTLTTNNVSNNSIKVTGKGNKERIIPISPKMAALLSGLNAGQKTRQKQTPLLSGSTPHCFPEEKKSDTLLSGQIIRDVVKHDPPPLLFGLNKNQVQYLCKKHLGCFPHTLRHSFATTLINAGAPLLSIRDLLGHESIATTQVYTALNIEKLKEVHERCFPKRPQGASSNEAATLLSEPS